MSSLTPDDLAAVMLSLRVAGAATLVALPIAVLVALAQARGRFALRVVLDAAVTLPLVLPPVATGYVLLLLFGRRGAFGQALEKIGVVFAFDWTGAALAAGVMAFPLMVRPIRLAIEAVDREVDEVARTLGAGRLVRLFRITLPLALPGVAAGAILGFAKALGEFGATITFVSNIPGETQTISSAIYSLIQTPDGDSAAARLVIISIVLAVGALVAAEVFARRATARLHGQ